MNQQRPQSATPTDTSSSLPPTSWVRTGSDSRSSTHRAGDGRFPKRYRTVHDSAQEPGLTREELESHASDLRNQLEHRIRELNRREAALNARIAEWENECRQAELRLTERELALLAERDAAESLSTSLAQRAEKLDRRRAELNHRERLLDEAEQLLERQTRDLQTRADELRRFRQRVASSAPTLANSPNISSREWELWQQRRETLAEQQRLEQQLRQVALDTQRKARTAA